MHSQPLHAIQDADGRPPPKLEPRKGLPATQEETSEHTDTDDKITDGFRCMPSPGHRRHPRAESTPVSPRRERVPSMPTDRRVLRACGEFEVLARC